MKKYQKFNRWLWGILVTAAVILPSFTAYADTGISRVRIYVSDDKLEDEESMPEITLPNNVSYSVSEVEAVTKRESWKPGSSPRIAVYLEAEDGYVFTASDKEDFSISGADYVSSTLKDDGHSMKLVIKYGPIRTVLGTPENVRWSETILGRALWKRVPYADSYYVYLVQDGDESGAKRYTTDTNYIDLLDKMKADSNYYFRVQAVPKDSGKKKYSQSGELVDSEIFYGSSLGETGGAWRKEGERYRYRSKSGEEYANTWKLIDGSWYYFDAEGFRSTGWFAVEGKRYYCDGEGKMLTGWIQVDGIWYYLKNSGESVTGWYQSLPSVWYYFDGEGRMLTGWQEIEGKWYYLKPSGEMAVSTTVDGWYVDQNGVWNP